MRILVDIPEDKLSDLSSICRSQEISRAEGIRRAVEMYIEKNSPKNNMRQAFGLWKDMKIDGVEYQRKLREEWD